MTDRAYRDVPATEVQQGLWLLRALGQEPAPRCRTYRVVGDLDVAALAVAWRSLVDRYEALRSALVLRGGVPVRRVWARSAARAFRLREVDGGPADDADEGPAGEGESEARLTVTRCGPEEYRVRLAVPRVCADEEFVDRLVDELSQLCAESASLTGLQDGDGAAGAADAASPEALAWWVQALDPLPSELPLPVDRPRPDRATGRWGTAGAPADPELGRAVARCAEASGSSPFVVLLTAFQVLLHRYTGGDRVAVAVPVSQGGACAAANVVLLPADIEAGHRFHDVLARGTVLAAEAMARRAVPLARVLGALPVVRDGRRVPLGDVVFDHRALPEPVLTLPGVVVEPCPEYAGPAPADLVLRVEDGGSGPAVTVLYDADQFEPATARMILRQFRTLLRHAVRAPHTPVGELTLDGLGEAARAAGEADRRAGDGASGHTVVEAIGRRASRDPDAVAVDGHDGTLTYRALHAAALRVAEDLRAAGVRSGDAVVVRLPAGVRQYAALLGALTAGAHVCWSGTADSGDRGRAVLAELKPAAMLVAADASGTDGAGTAGKSRTGAGEPDPAGTAGTDRTGAAEPGPAGTAETDRISAAETDPTSTAGTNRPSTPGTDPAGTAAPDALLDWYRTTIGGHAVPVAEPDPAPRAGVLSSPPRGPGLTDRAYVAFTSGTTGVPKGIAHGHAALAQFAAWLAAEFEIGPGVRVAQWVAAEHDPALAETFAALGSGATLCPVPEKIRANPERLLDWLAAERIGVLQTVPSFARELLRVLAERHSAERLGALRVLLLMGEALPGELADGLLAALPLVRVANLYGPTETVAATWHPVRRRAAYGAGTSTSTGPAGSASDEGPAKPAAAPVPIGRPIPGRGVLVVDAADRVCPAGVTGELVVTGPYVADGYLGVPEHAAFTRLPGIDAPCYRTGDLARRSADGALEYRGRKDSQVKLYGSRLELTDVEAALAGHATVAECAVVAGADRDGLAVRLVICVVPHRAPDGEPQGSPGQWRSHLRRRFGRALLPALFRTLDRLPRTVTGKVDRPQLTRAVAAAERDAAARRPAAGTEAGLAEVWAELLGAPPDHVDQSFFAVGGTSLLVPRLLHEVRRRFAADVTVPQFYAHQSLAALAALVDRTP